MQGYIPGVKAISEEAVVVRLTRYDNLSRYLDLAEGKLCKLQTLMRGRTMYHANHRVWRCPPRVTSLGDPLVR